MAAATVLQRLTEIDPACFKDRMVQRLVKGWRMEMAGLIIFDGGWIKSLPVSPTAATGGEKGHVGTTALGNTLGRGNRGSIFQPHT